MAENRVKQHKFSSKKEVTRENRRNVNVQVSAEKGSTKAQFFLKKGFLSFEKTRVMTK